MSNFIRLHQAMDKGGRVVKLDLYEGMPHVFQIINPDTDEAQSAVRKSAAFMKEYLSSQHISR